MAGAVVLLSGGLDSTVNFKCALDRSGVSLALTFDYGQRAAGRELQAVRDMCGRFGVQHRALSLSWLGEGSRAAILSNDADLPEPEPGELDDADGAAARSADAVWVPNRNGVFVNVAAALAEQIGAPDVVVGFNAEEGATFPDNTAGFVAAVNSALAFSTRGAVRVRCDTLDLGKSDVLRLGLRIGAPLDLVWPCYRGGERLCGRCESCRRFLRAAHEAGLEHWFRRRHARMPENG